jgi:hypothetical protein
MEHFDYERTKSSSPVGGLQSIGDTRFATVYWAADSVKKGLPVLRTIVAKEELGIDIAVSFYIVPLSVH